MPSASRDLRAPAGCPTECNHDDRLPHRSSHRVPRFLPVGRCLADDKTADLVAHAKVHGVPRKALNVDDDLKLARGFATRSVRENTQPSGGEFG